jgi:hypothetical protein
MKTAYEAQDTPNHCDYGVDDEKPVHEVSKTLDRPSQNGYSPSPSSKTTRTLHCSSDGGLESPGKHTTQCLTFIQTVSRDQKYSLESQIRSQEWYKPILLASSIGVYQCINNAIIPGQALLSQRPKKTRMLPSTPSNPLST